MKAEEKPMSEPNKPACALCNDTKQIPLTLQGEGTTAPCSCVNIEPTEEQWQAARDAYEDGFGEISVERVARLLAQVSDNVRLRVSAEERERMLQTLAFDETAALIFRLRTRIVELERTEAKLTNACAMNSATLKRRAKREAKHLAHIKVLETHLADHEEEDGIWIPRAEFLKPYDGGAQ